MPKLGSETTGLAEALFTGTQRRVLGLLFGQPRRSFLLSELIALAGAGSGAVQRELARLTASGLVTISEEVGRKTYRANPGSPIFRELCSIVAKTSGAAALLRAALEPHADRIAAAVLFGSVAKGTQRAASDVDVLIVADDLTLEEAHAIVAPVERRLGARVSPTLYTRTELKSRLRAKSSFLARVLDGPHVTLIGSVDAAAR